MYIEKKRNRLFLLDDYIKEDAIFWPLEIHLNFQLHPTEPANYTDSYIRVRKRIVDKEIGMLHGSTTILTTAMQVLSSLLKLTVSEEQEEEGCLRT